MSPSLIRRAILERHQVHAVFRGRFRELCPYVLGTKNGRRQALFFQFGGESRRGLPPGGDWRCLPVDELTEVSVHEGPWYGEDGYDPSQSCVDRVEVEVTANLNL
ncbi:MAG TPA: hypothetical protein VHB53_01110 [Solirubrobacterales bacterium]|nr:hypothetical protein [Solirubrobacterales bacterium]